MNEWKSFFFIVIYNNDNFHLSVYASCMMKGLYCAIIIIMTIYSYYSRIYQTNVTLTYSHIHLNCIWRTRRHVTHFTWYYVNFFFLLLFAYLVWYMYIYTHTHTEKRNFLHFSYNIFWFHIRIQQLLGKIMFLLSQYYEHGVYVPRWCFILWARQIM